jgi:hemolysin activation/secretion protein
MRPPIEARAIRAPPGRLVARLTHSRSLLLALALAWISAADTVAQDIRPGDERPELPGFEPDAEDRRPALTPLPSVPSFEPRAREKGSVLPQLALPDGQDIDGLEGGAQVVVREFAISGNTALDPEALAGVTRPYLDRPLAFSRGYVTSGVVIPDQTLADGVLEVWVIEGRLEKIEIYNEGRLRESYLRRQLARGAKTPVNVHDLERALQILQQDDRIEAVDATLVPSERRGEAILRVRVLERRAWSVRLAGNNYNSPAIGEWRGVFRAAHRNLSGFGDRLSAEYKGSSGLQDVRGSWEVPLPPFETRLEAHFRRTWSQGVEAPYDTLDINSQTQTYGFTLTQPLYRSASTLVEGFFVGEWRKSQSFIFGDVPFSFVAGPIRGTGKAAILRFGGSATYSTREQALAARGLISWGLDALGATVNEGDVPDGQFLAFLGQLQWARRLPWWDLQLIARADVQVSDRPLLGIEQFSMGGHASVRGYRENTLVRDNGVIASLELRIPVPMPSFRESRPRLEIAPFFDVGHSWNTDRPTVGPQTVASIGIGGRLGLTERALFQVYWGHRLLDVPVFGEGALQDDGVSMGLTWDW